MNLDAHGCIVFRGYCAGFNSRDTGHRSDDERASGTSQGRAQSFNDLAIFLTVHSEVREIMVEGGMNDRVGGSCSITQNVQILQAAEMNLCSSADKGLSARVRSGEAKNLVSRVDELGDDRRTDKARCSCKKDPHANAPCLLFENSWSKFNDPHDVFFKRSTGRRAFPLPRYRPVFVRKCPCGTVWPNKRQADR